MNIDEKIKNNLKRIEESQRRVDKLLRKQSILNDKVKSHQHEHMKAYFRRQMLGHPND